MGRSKSYYLTSEEETRVAECARALGRSESWVVREAINRFWEDLKKEGKLGQADN